MKTKSNAQYVLAIALILTTFLFLATPNMVSASTNASGSILADTTWTLSASPYIVTDDVVVVSGVTLTIEPGVVVMFDQGKALIVNGTLIARGTTMAGITFTSNQAIQSPGDWANILFTSTSTPAQFGASGNYLSGSILQFITVEYAGIGVPGALTLEGAAPFIDHSTVRLASARGLYIDGASTNVMVTNNRFENSAPSFHPAIHVGGSAIVSDNTITGGSYSGIYVETIQSVTISRNTISGITITSSPVLTGGGITIRSGTALIEDNYITGNSVTSDPCCAWIAGGIFSGGNSIITGNTVSDNFAHSTASGVASGIQVAASNNIVSNNIVTNNSGAFAIYVQVSTNTRIENNIVSYNSGGVLFLSDDGIISNNTITNNSYVGIFPYLGGCCGLRDLTISGNLIANNLIGIRMFGWNDYATINIMNNRIEDNGEGGIFHTKGSLTCNTIVNNGSQAGNNGYGIFFEVSPPSTFVSNTLSGNSPYDVFNSIKGSAVLAENNWWGTTNVMQIDAHIYDFFDDAAKSVVDYTPFLTTPNSCAPSTNQPPTVDAGGSYIVGEGDSVAVEASGNDPDGDQLSYEWDLDNNGSFETSGQSATFSAVGQDGPSSYIIKVRATDSGGLFAADEATVNVLNVPPTLNTPAVPLEPSIKGSAVTASAIFTDSAPNDSPFTCTVNYGDGPGHLAGTISGNTCNGPSHTYVNIGSYTITVSVTDKDAGTGSTSTAHAVIYNFTGFFQPVDNPGPVFVFNVMKAGRGVAVKFSLSGDQGLNIFPTGYPKSQQVTCDGAASLDNIEETIPVGGSSISYDPVTNQYSYNWKTNTAWAGTCRQLIVRLIDGTEHIAYFKFR